MEKTTFLILILVLVSIAIFIFSTLVYYGGTRFFKLRYTPQSTQFFKKSYPSLPHADKNCKIVISFTTTPERLSLIEPMLASLLDQTVKINQFALNIPPGKKYEIPPHYKWFLNVFKIGKDYKSCMGLLPCLRREGEKNTKILYVRDDQIYGKNFVETMINKSKEEPNKVITTHPSLDLNQSCILVKPDFFDPSILDIYEKNYKRCWLKNHLTAPPLTISYSGNFTF